MTDARLRAAERTAATDASPEAQAALLRERLRAGTLDPARLELAAYCGHEGAREALGLDPWGGFPRYAEDPPPFTAQDGSRYEFVAVQTDLAPAYALRPWVAGLARWGDEALTRAAVAAARVALPVWEQAVGPNPGLERRAALDAAESLLAQTAPDPIDPFARQRAWLDAINPSTYTFRTHALTPERFLMWAWLTWMPAPSVTPTRRASEIAAAAQVAGEQPVREAIQHALCAWALS